MWKNGPSLTTGRIFILSKLTLWASATFQCSSSKLTLSLNLQAQTSFFLSFLFLFLHTCCFSSSSSSLLFSSLLLSCGLHVVVDFHPPRPALSPLSVTVLPCRLRCGNSRLWGWGVDGLSKHPPAPPPPPPPHSTPAAPSLRVLRRAYSPR